MGTLDELRELGCSISITTTTTIDRFFVQLTLMHGDDFCGHTGRAMDTLFGRALKSAAEALLQAAKGSNCKVDVETLQRIASEMDERRSPPVGRSSSAGARLMY